jgi:hypothetical protein
MASFQPRYAPILKRQGFSLTPFQPFDLQAALALSLPDLQFIRGLLKRSASRDVLDFLDSIRNWGLHKQALLTNPVLFPFVRPRTPVDQGIHPVIEALTWAWTLREADRRNLPDFPGLQEFLQSAGRRALSNLQVPTAGALRWLERALEQGASLLGGTATTVPSQPP